MKMIRCAAKVYTKIIQKDQRSHFLLGTLPPPPLDIANIPQLPVDVKKKTPISPKIFISTRLRPLQGTMKNKKIRPKIAKYLFHLKLLFSFLKIGPMTAPAVCMNLKIQKRVTFLRPIISFIGPRQPL